MKKTEPEQKIPVAVVCGPTASGKTALAVELALRFGGEVISADSMQIYRDLPVGTAQPSQEEMRGVPHHLIGFCGWDTPFSVADYLKLAARCIQEIRARGRLPVLAGGTGLYLSSLLHNLSLAREPRDDVLRQKLEQRARQEGGAALLEELRAFDPETAARLHPKDVKRIVRAVELYRLTGKTMTRQREESRRLPSPYRACWLGLAFEDRQLLYQRINRRVDVMLENGLLEEARRLLEAPGAATVKQAIGYKELFPYLRGECSLEEAVETLKRETRRFAKRQLTWFRREEEIHWLKLDRLDGPALLEQAAGLVEKVLEIGYNE